MKPSDLRPVRVILNGRENDVVNGLFHCWGGLNEHAYALIETEEGCVLRFSTWNCSIEFLDREK